MNVRWNGTGLFIKVTQATKIIVLSCSTSGLWKNIWISLFYLKMALFRGNGIWQYSKQHIKLELGSMPSTIRRRKFQMLLQGLLIWSEQTKCFVARVIFLKINIERFLHLTMNIKSWIETILQTNYHPLKLFFFHFDKFEKHRKCFHICYVLLGAK